MIYSRGQGSLIQVRMLKIRARKLTHKIKMLAMPDGGKRTNSCELSSALHACTMPLLSQHTKDIECFKNAKNYLC